MNYFIIYLFIFVYSIISVKVSNAGGDIFVTTNGRDGEGCGDESSPCKTIEYVVNKIVKQNLVNNVFVASGGYDEHAILVGDLVLSWYGKGRNDSLLGINEDTPLNNQEWWIFVGIGRLSISDFTIFVRTIAENYTTHFNFFSCDGPNGELFLHNILFQFQKGSRGGDFIPMHVLSVVMHYEPDNPVTYFNVLNVTSCEFRNIYSKEENILCPCELNLLTVDNCTVINASGKNALFLHSMNPFVISVINCYSQDLVGRADGYAEAGSMYFREWKETCLISNCTFKNVTTEIGNGGAILFHAALESKFKIMHLKFENCTCPRGFGSNFFIRGYDFLSLITSNNFIGYFADGSDLSLFWGEDLSSENTNPRSIVPDLIAIQGK